jgi:hypothetical protein
MEFEKWGRRAEVQRREIHSERRKMERIACFVRKYFGTLLHAVQNRDFRVTEIPE